MKLPVKTGWGTLVAWALLFVSARAFAATPAQYDAALSRVQAALAARVDSVQSEYPLPSAQMPLAVAVRALTPIRALERPGQAPQPVNSVLLLKAIDQADRVSDAKTHVRRLQEVSGQIALLRRELASVPGSAPSGRRAVDAAHAVLAGDAYGFDPVPPPSRWDRWAQRMARNFENWLDRLFRRSPRPMHMPSISPAFIKGLTFVLIAGVFIALVAVLVPLIRARAPRARPLALDETEAALMEARDTDSLHALAEQKAREGEYRLALRFIYLATLVSLDTGGILRFDRSKTNWEYLRALREAGREDVYRAMTPLTRDFDHIWYGFGHADATDYARARTQYEALLAASQTPAPPSTPPSGRPAVPA